MDFENLDQHKEEFSGFDVVFCCLGTTRSAAGSKVSILSLLFNGYCSFMIQESGCLLTKCAVICQQRPECDQNSFNLSIYVVKLSVILSGASANSG